MGYSFQIGPLVFDLAPPDGMGSIGPVSRRGVFRSAWYSICFGPYFSIYGLLALRAYRSQFSGERHLVGAVFRPRRPLVFDLGPPGALGVYRPVLQGVVFLSVRYSGRIGPILIYGPLALWPSIAPRFPERVSAIAVVWPCRPPPQPRPLFPTYHLLAPCGYIGHLPECDILADVVFGPYFSA